MMRGDYTYIWQANDWPNWRFDLAVLAGPMAEVSRAQGLLMGRLADVGMALRDQASLVVLTEDVIKTSEIEGEHLNVESVRSSIARRLGVDIGAMAPVDRRVEGVVEMALDATAHGTEPMTQERYQATLQGHDVSYVEADSEFARYALADADERARLLKGWVAADLLVLDDLFLARRISEHAAELLQTLVHQRYKLRRSIVVTSNRIVQDWGRYLGDATMATTILDRLMHRCAMLEFEGKSYRLKEAAARLVISPDPA
jgi:hypothetical protein